MNQQDRTTQDTVRFPTQGAQQQTPVPQPTVRKPRRRLQRTDVTQAGQPTSSSGQGQTTSPQGAVPTYPPHYPPQTGGMPVVVGYYPVGTQPPPMHTGGLAPMAPGQQMMYTGPHVVSSSLGPPPMPQREEDIPIHRQSASAVQRARPIWNPFFVLLFGLGLMAVGLGAIVFDIFTTFTNIEASFVSHGSTVVLACTTGSPKGTFWLSPAFWLSPDTLLALLPGLIVEAIGTSVTIITSDTYVEIFKHIGDANYNAWDDPKFKILFGIQVASQIFNILMTSSFIATKTQQNLILSGLIAALIVIGSLAFFPAGIRLVVWAAKKCWEWLVDTFSSPAPHANTV